MKTVHLAAVSALLVLSAAPAGAVAITTSYSENFDSLARTGTSSALPAGWTFVETGNNANSTYAAGTGSDNQGNTYSFGAANGTDRALGTLRSGSLVSTISLTLTNANDRAIEALTLGYVGEFWRLGALNRGADRLDVSYSLNGGSSFTALDDLDFATPVTTGTVGFRDGNAAANRRSLSTTLSGLNLAAGQSIVLRWTDFDVSNADDGLAIDDFTATATLVAPAVVPEPASWALMIAGFGLTGATLRRRRIATVTA